MVDDEIKAYYEFIEKAEQFLRTHDDSNYLDGENLSIEDQECVEKGIEMCLEQAKKIEPEITSVMKSVVNDGIGKFEGFEHRLKKRNSLARKIISDGKIRGIIDEAENKYIIAAKNICDSVRYTITLNDDVYLEKMDEYLHKIESLGYEIIEIKNNWATNPSGCKGFNVRVALNDIDNSVFEIQFHTSLGYYIKEKTTRTIYDVIRNRKKDKEKDKELLAKALYYRKLFFNRTPYPDGVLEYDYEPKVDWRKYGK